MTSGDRFKKRQVLRRGLSYFPARLQRLAQHFSPVHDKPYGRNAVDFIPDVLFLMAELLFLPEVYDLLILMIKPNTRHLTDLEYAMAEEVYGGMIDLKEVMVDANASFLVKKFSFAYVSFNTINYHQELKESVLIHELFHVLQYQKFGALYIYRALKAQRSKEGYDYGGAYGLMDAQANNLSLWEFNFEQQAQIVEDFYTINNDFSWNMNSSVYGVYEYYYKQIKTVAN